MAPLRALLTALCAGSRRAPNMVLMAGGLRINGPEGLGSLEVPFSLLPENLRRRGRGRAATLRDTGRAIAATLLSVDAAWIGIGPHAESADRGDWSAYHRVRLYGEGLMPDFMNYRPYVHAGSPWRQAMCAPQPESGGRLLPDALVEDAHATTPHVLEIARTFSDIQDGRWSWSLRDSGGVSFDDEPVAAMDVVRAIASIPPHLRPEARA